MLIKKTSKLALFLLGIVTTSLTSLPVKAAEKLFLSYGPLKFSVEVESLEIFAKDGTVNEDLGQYLDLIPPEKRDKFRESLTKKVPLEPVLVSRFFNSEMGEQILLRLGKGITLEGGENGGIALRGAIVQSAFDPDGLTLLNILKKYPTNLQIQGELIKGAVEEGDKIISATENLVKEMRTWTAEEASNNPSVDYAKLPDIRKAGQYQVKKEVWQLTDTSRNRKFYVDVYVPQGVSRDKIPVIVFSHGLSSRPEDFADPLNHLASYGYVVAAPQHIGSDIIYLKEMFEGYHKNIFDRDEFINRPKDISFVIDELERRNPTEFKGRLDLQNVGMAGHSFGGYTALAIAGATIDFDYLQKACERPYGGLDVAILLECRVLELPRQDYQFRDSRVTAVFAGNPVVRYIFGQTGISKIDIPVLLASGSDDPAAPPVFEQGMPFIWLNTPDKYWMLAEGQAHVNFSKLDGGIKQALDSTVHLTLPSQDLISSYVKGTSLAFFEVHLKNNQDFRKYLQSSYAQYLSENQDFKLNFITNASADKVKNSIEKFDN
ncbi:alpha/beta hydrolase [Geminocystis herdmanii]|uniref:alpha/beta hydrolase n=1 Tax=Geminocystis herdmanii TaxID=669359 RepID=UPI0003458F01|nr:alpha/beta hydrolase [Geminocystis herdmanii]